METVDSMTMSEVKSLIGGWSESPPLVFLVESLIRGLGGERPTESITDDQISKLVAESRGSIPLVGRDPRLPPLAPVFDLEEMRQKNRTRLIERAVKRV